MILTKDYILTKINLNCNKILPSGEKCGRKIGSCIHYYAPTPMGKQVGTEKG